MLPVSLDHDGLLVVFKGNLDVRGLSSFLTSDMQPWADYLLSKDDLEIMMPIEPKLLVTGGEILKNI